MANVLDDDLETLDFADESDGMYDDGYNTEQPYPAWMEEDLY